MTRQSWMLGLGPLTLIVGGAGWRALETGSLPDPQLLKTLFVGACLLGIVCLLIVGVQLLARLVELLEVSARRPGRRVSPEGITESKVIRLRRAGR